MLFITVRDSISYINFSLKEENLSNTKIVFNDYIYAVCLGYMNEDKPNFLSLLTFEEREAINAILGILYENKDSNKTKQELKDFIEPFNDIYSTEKNFYDFFDCGFVRYYVNLLNKALWDFAWETRILCALSCCIGFFGSVAVHNLLWVMY